MHEADATTAADQGANGHADVAGPAADDLAGPAADDLAGPAADDLAGPAADDLAGPAAEAPLPSGGRFDRFDGYVQATLKYVPLVLLMVLFVARFGTDSADNLRAYQQDAYDFSLYDQGIWLMSRFHAPFMTVMGTNMFAAHTVFIFILLVPLYWVYPHAASLLYLQAAAMALGAVPIFLLGRRLLRSSILATLLAAAYLLNPATQLGTLEQFHVEAFEAPLLALAIYCIVAWKPRLLLMAVVLLLLCKQDDALYLVPLGLVVMASGHRRFGMGIAGAAAAVGVAENVVLIPLLLNGVPISYGGWWPFGSFSHTVQVVIRSPGQLWSFLTTNSNPSRLWYMWQMAFGSGLLFILSPWVLAIGLLEFGADSLSSNPYLHEISRHYAMPLAAIFACAGVCAVAQLATPRRRLVATVLATLCALWSCVLWGDAPFSDNKIMPANPNDPGVVALNQLVAAELPPNAALSTAENLAPNLDHRDQVYLFPTPFAQSYYGNPKYDGTELPFASQVQYLLLPSCIPCDGNMGQPDQDVLNRIAGQFHIIGRTPDYVLYKRGRQAGHRRT